MRPRKSVASVRRRITECVIYDTLTVVRGELIMPASGRFVLIDIFLLARTETQIGSKAVGTLAPYITADIVYPDICFVIVVVILSDKSVQVVIVILGKQPLGISDCLDVTRLVIGVELLYYLLKALSI